MPRKHSYSQMVALFDYAQLSQKWTEWDFRRVSERSARQLVADGQAVPITRKMDGTVQVVGYQSLQPRSIQRPSPTTLTLATINSVANAVSLPGHQRPELSGRERDEIFKFKVWALIGDTRAVAVRPRISAAERAEAEKLLSPKPVRTLQLRACCSRSLARAA